MNLNQLLQKHFSDIRSTYTKRDTMLYALGVNACRYPLDENELQFCYERNLQSVPSISCVLAHPGFWVNEPALEINWVKLVHAEQRFNLATVLPIEGEVVGKYRIKSVVDKGPEKGALLAFEKALYTTSGSLLGTVDSTYFLRGDGGTPDDELPSPPATAPSGAVETTTLPTAALIYRLSGDYNPLHGDPAVAQKAGFDRPILHGLCTFGIACQQLVRAVCANDAQRLRGLGGSLHQACIPWRNDSDRILGKHSRHCSSAA
ncbi:MAG: MaoC/PaaZ C-terminal domain-containing protein [Steroidobacteraceae bacterium]